MSKRLIYPALVVICASLISTSAVKADLLGWWRFEEGSGDTANDSSGNDHHGTLLGVPEWGSGPAGSGGAVVFDPEGCVGMDCGVFDPTDGTGQFSLALWAFWDGTGDFQHFMTKSSGWGADTMMFQIELWGAHTEATYTDRVGASYQAAGSIPFSIMPKNEWVHLTFTFDGSMLTLYLNGVDEEGPKQFSIGPNTDAMVEIGYNSNRPTISERTFHGILDEVRLYSHALSETEVLAAMQGGSWPYAFGPDPEDGAMHNDTWITLKWSAGDSAVSHDVYLGDNYDDVLNGTGDTFHGNQNLTFIVAGFPGYPYPDGLVPGTTYYWRIDEVNDADPNSPWKGPVWSFSIPPKTAYNPNPSDGDGLGATSADLTWTSGYGAKLHTIYIGDDYDEVNNATVGVSKGTATYSTSPLEAEKVYYWRVDEFDGLGTYKGDVWTFTTPGAVGNPQPSNGATNIAMATILSWAPADNAASHQVYLGLDKEAVRSADSSSPEYKGPKTLGDESYDPGLLEANTTYYWRVDEVYDGSPVKGPVWDFTVGDYLIVEDFESYTDDDAAGEAIWQTWIDGFGIADNGAQVGYLMPPYAEQTIVHGGAQSMPLLYLNEAGVTNSEAELTLSAEGGRDWTVAGIGELSLWFRGASDNATEPLYVAIANTSGPAVVVAHDDPSAATKTSWTQWRISLQAFADQGINLSNVDKLAIGLGDKSGTASSGGSGTMYIDDIRLYQP